MSLWDLGGKLSIVGTGLQPWIGATRAAVAVVEVSDSKSEPAKSSASLKFYQDLTPQNSVLWSATTGSMPSLGFVR